MPAHERGSIRTQRPYAVMPEPGEFERRTREHGRDAAPADGVGDTGVQDRHRFRCAVVFQYGAMALDIDAEYTGFRVVLHRRRHVRILAVPLAELGQIAAKLDGGWLQFAIKMQGSGLL